MWLCSSRKARRTAPARCLSAYRPRLEALEDRVVPTTLTFIDPSNNQLLDPATLILQASVRTIPIAGNDGPAGPAIDNKFLDRAATDVAPANAPKVLQAHSLAKFAPAGPPFDEIPLPQPPVYDLSHNNDANVTFVKDSDLLDLTVTNRVAPDGPAHLSATDNMFFTGIAHDPLAVRIDPERGEHVSDPVHVKLTGSFQANGGGSVFLGGYGSVDYKITYSRLQEPVPLQNPLISGSFFYVGQFGQEQTVDFFGTVGDTFGVGAVTTGRDVLNFDPTEGLQGAFNSTLHLNVQVAKLQSINVTADRQSVNVGDPPVQFHARGTFTDESTKDLTDQVSWDSSDSSVASIERSSGLASPGSAGTTEITAQIGGVSGSAELTVSANKPSVAPTSLTWDTDQGGVDFGYQVSNAALTKDTQVSLYWSSSSRFADVIGGPVYSRTIPTGTQTGTYGPFNLPAATLGEPPQGANYLLAVTDPQNVLGNFDASKNVAAIPYVPKVTVTAKYDGSPDSGIMGRYFSGTDVLKDNTFTVTISDSLDALRPSVVVKVGGQMLDTTVSPTDFHKYVTAAFDPGSLTQEFTSLQAQALIGTADIADASASIQVEPLPQWVKDLLNEKKPTFDPNGDNVPGGHGAYIFDGFLPDLTLSGTVFTVPDDVPFIGGEDLTATAGFEVKTIAPLAVSSAPTVEAGLKANLTLGDSITLPVFSLPPTAKFDPNVTLTVTPGSTLDPVTLNEVGGFSLTVALDIKDPKPLKATLYKKSTVIFPFGVPTFLNFEVTASLGAVLHLHAQIADSGSGLQLLRGGTYVGVGLTGSLTATAQGGWPAPPWVKNMLNWIYNGGGIIPELTLKDTATLTLGADAEVHAGGSVSSPEYSGFLFKGSATFSDKLELIFSGLGTQIDLPIADLEKNLFTWP
jgi:hypothetical protein